MTHKRESNNELANIQRLGKPELLTSIWKSRVAINTETELPFSLFLVRLIEEHCERDDQEHEHRVHDVHNVPQLLHGEG